MSLRTRALVSLAALSILAGVSFSSLAVAGSHSGEVSKTDTNPLVVEQSVIADFSVVADTLRQQLKADGWNLIAEIDLGTRLQKKGVDIPGGLVIFKLTSGKNAVPLLAMDETRYFSAFMPCGVSLYGMSDGSVVVSRMNHAMMGSMMAPKLADVMHKSAAKIDKSIAAAIAKLGDK